MGSASQELREIVYDHTLKMDRWWYKIIDSENFIKVSQNPNKVAGDTQGLPTVPHNDFGGLNFKGLASNYLLLMATSPYKVTFSKKKS